MAGVEVAALLGVGGQVGGPGEGIRRLGASPEALEEVAAGGVEEVVPVEREVVDDGQAPRPGPPPRPSATARLSATTGDGASPRSWS